MVAAAASRRASPAPPPASAAISGRSFLDPDGQTLSEHLMDIHTVHVDPGGVPELVPQKKKKKKE